MPSLIESRSPINVGWFYYSNHGGNLLLTWLCSLVHHLQYGTCWIFLCVFHNSPWILFVWNINAPDIKVWVAQLCPILCDRMDCGPPGSTVHGILQARILEWYPFPSPGDLPDPEIKPGTLHCRQFLYHMSHQGRSSRSKTSLLGERCTSLKVCRGTINCKIQQPLEVQLVRKGWLQNVGLDTYHLFSLPWGQLPLG